MVRAGRPAAGLIAPIALALALAPGASGAEAPDRDPGRAVGSALGKGGYPWYDRSKDAARPIKLPRQPAPAQAGPSGSTNSTGPGRWGIGNTLSTTILVAGLVALVGLMAWFWRAYRPVDGPDAGPSTGGRGGASKVEALPAGLRGEFESSDPWEEALRRRARGDLAGAAICLFAHQLLTLSRLGLVRLGPGRTGRQLLRSVVDAEFRGLVGPTLRLFEAVYYGHRTPSDGEFAAVWARAEAFERRVAAGVAI